MSEWLRDTGSGSCKGGGGAAAAAASSSHGGVRGTGRSESQRRERGKRRGSSATATTVHKQQGTCCTGPAAHRPNRVSPGSCQGQVPAGCLLKSAHTYVCVARQDTEEQHVVAVSTIAPCVPGAWPQELQSPWLEFPAVLPYYASHTRTCRVCIVPPDMTPCVCVCAMCC